MALAMLGHQICVSVCIVNAGALANNLKGFLKFHSVLYHLWALGPCIELSQSSAQVRKLYGLYALASKPW